MFRFMVGSGTCLLQVQVQVCDNSAHGVMENWDPSHFPGCAPAWYNPKRYDNTT